MAGSGAEGLFPFFAGASAELDDLLPPSVFCADIADARSAPAVASARLVRARHAAEMTGIRFIGIGELRMLSLGSVAAESGQGTDGTA
jgi:hypothetical protein